MRVLVCEPVSAVFVFGETFGQVMSLIKMFIN